MELFFLSSSYTLLKCCFKRQREKQTFHPCLPVLNNNKIKTEKQQSEKQLLLCKKKKKNREAGFDSMNIINPLEELSHEKNCCVQEFPTLSFGTPQ